MHAGIRESVLTHMLPDPCSLLPPYAGTQIMMAVTANGQRPEMPADPVLLLGGSFPGLPEYRGLMEACWDADAAARPSAEHVSILASPLSQGQSEACPRLCFSRSAGFP